MMTKTNKKMILFHTRSLHLAPNWIIEFNILYLLFKGRFQ